MRLRLSVFRARSSHSWSRKDRSTGAALSSLREQGSSRATEQCPEREARTQKRGARGGGKREEEDRQRLSFILAASCLSKRVSCARILAPPRSSPPLFPPSSSRSPRVLWFLTFRATFITHRLPPVDSSWWLRRVPCCRRSRRLGTAFGSHSWARPSARPWRVADVCTRRPCYSPRTRATACYRTRCAHSCQRRRKAGGPDAVRDCCDTPAGIRRE